MNLRRRYIAVCHGDNHHHHLRILCTHTHTRCRAILLKNGIILIGLLCLFPFTFVTYSVPYGSSLLPCFITAPIILFIEYISYTSKHIFIDIRITL